MNNIHNNLDATAARPSEQACAAATEQSDSSCSSTTAVSPRSTRGKMIVSRSKEAAVNNSSTNVHDQRQAILELIGEIQSSLSQLGLGNAERTLAASLRNALREPDFAGSLPFIVKFLRTGNERALAYADRLDALMLGAQESKAMAPPAREQPAAVAPSTDNKQAEDDVLTIPDPPPHVVGQVVDEKPAMDHNQVQDGDGSSSAMFDTAYPMDAQQDNTLETNITEDEPMEIPVGSYKLASPFVDLLGPDADSLPLIVAAMKTSGFDRSEPVIIWKEKNILVDGHQRESAAREAKLTHIPAIFKSFPDEEAALHYAIRRQTHRRNASDGMLMKLLIAVDKRQKRGGDRRSDKAPIKTSGKVLVRSAEKTAEILGTSRTKIEKLRAILDHGDQLIIDAVKEDEMSANAAYNKIRAEAVSRKAMTAPQSSGKPAIDSSIAKHSEGFDGDRASVASAASSPDKKVGHPAAPKKPSVEESDVEDEQRSEPVAEAITSRDADTRMDADSLRLWAACARDLGDDMEAKKCGLASQARSLQRALEAELAAAENEV